MPAPFTAKIEVRFGDCDPAGIGYFPTIYHYCHVAFEDAWRVALGTPYSELVARHRLGFPTVHVETDFVSPLRYGDVVSIDVAVERIGRSSVVFRFEGRVDARTVFRSAQTTVCLELDGFSTREIPDALRTALGELAT